MDPRTIILFTTDSHDRARARELCDPETHDVREFDTAEEALASLLDDPCAVALVDLDAPGASEVLAAVRQAPRMRMPVLGASRRERADIAPLCDHVEVGPRPFLTIALELALALEEAEAIRPGQEVRPRRDAASVGVVRAVTGENVVLHLFGAGRRTIPLAAVERVEGSAIIVDAVSLSGEIGEAMFREDDEPLDRAPRRPRPADRVSMRSQRSTDKARLASHRRHPRDRRQALVTFAAKLAQRWSTTGRAA